MNVPVKTFYYFLCHALKARDGEEKEEEEKKEGREVVVEEEGLLGE